MVNAHGEIVAGLDLNEDGFIDSTFERFAPGSERSYPRQTYFWLTETLLLMITLISRIGFIFKPN
jgi:apolipoprotein N-acyltransferase